MSSPALVGVVDPAPTSSGVMVEHGGAPPLRPGWYPPAKRSRYCAYPVSYRRLCSKHLNGESPFQAFPGSRVHPWDKLFKVPHLQSEQTNHLQYILLFQLRDGHLQPWEERVPVRLRGGDVLQQGQVLQRLGPRPACRLM